MRGILREAANLGGLQSLPKWWKKIDASRAWQDGVFDGLAVAYALIALIALIQIVRIQIRVPMYGWTTQKVFHLLNAIVCGFRAGVFVARRAVADIPSELTQDALLGAPGLLFMSTYALLVLFWAEIYYQARSVPTGGLRPLFVALNAGVYLVQFAVWAWTAADGNRDLGAQLSGCFLACVSAAAGAAFLLYGGRLFLMLRRFPIESAGRRKKLREVGLVTAICSSCFFFRAAVQVWSAFDAHDASLDVLKHPLLNLIYYSGSELIPATLVLYILRKLPPRKTQGYAPIPSQ